MSIRWFRRRGATRLAAAAPLVALLLLPACRETDLLRDALDPPSAHEAYAEALQRIGLDRTALGREWIAAADRALREPVPVPLPFRAAGYFPQAEASAFGYRLEAREGQRLLVVVRTEAERPLRVFVDLFRLPEESGEEPKRIAEADSAAGRLEVEVGRDGAYLLRLQPELLRSGRYEVEIRTAATLAFPVTGLDSRAIRSRFGAERDGGRRQHQGVDIFAGRGTPVLAATTGFATPGTNRLGGQVVWLWDERRDQVLYYAHLDSQAVAPGERVVLGDTIGFVGNSGNARSTPPHLHFGIYRPGRGALDPYPFLHEPSEPPPAPAVDPTLFGRPARVATRELPLRVSPAGSAEVLRRLPRRTLVRVEGGTGPWYRVTLPDGGTGYVPGRFLESAEPGPSRELPRSALLRETPAPDAVPIGNLGAGERVAVLGRYGEFLYVRAGEVVGWVTWPT